MKRDVMMFWTKLSPDKNAGLILILYIQKCVKGFYLSERWCQSFSSRCCAHWIYGNEVPVHNQFIIILLKRVRKAITDWLVGIQKASWFYMTMQCLIQQRNLLKNFNGRSGNTVFIVLSLHYVTATCLVLAKQQYHADEDVQNTLLEWLLLLDGIFQ